MSSRSLALAAAGIALLAASGTAQAAPACKLLSDPAGDATVMRAPGTPNVKPADVHSMDVATGKKTLVVALRTASTNPADDPAGTVGVSWSAQFTIKGVAHQFTRRIGPNGAVTDTATAGGTAISGVTVTVASGTVTWKVARKNVPSLRKRGAVLTDLFASTSAGSFYASDYAPDNKVASPVKYPDRKASCLRPA